MSMVFLKRLLSTIEITLSESNDVFWKPEMLATERSAGPRHFSGSDLMAGARLGF